MDGIHRFSTALRQETRRRLEELGHSDIVVGIPAYNTAGTISRVIKMASRGLQRYFHDFHSLIFVADGGSTDDTRERAESLHIDSYNVETIISIYRGLPGKGSAIRAIMEAAHFLRARACLFIDADLQSITPEWIRNLAEPIIDLGYDFVTPYYRRFKYDATITNTVAYTLTRALYGFKIRQPIGGDFGLSRAALIRFLEQDVWETDIARFGIDIWLTTTAITQGLRICQARLGAKIHAEKDPSEHLGPMFRQVVGTIFSLMKVHEKIWKSIHEEREIDTFGEEPSTKPHSFVIQHEPLIEAFRFGFHYFHDLWARIIAPDVFQYLEKLIHASPAEFHLSPEIWAKIVYDFAVTYKNWPMHRGKLLDIMLPLYNARVASLLNELEPIPDEEAESFFEKQALAFVQLKPYLIKKWDDPSEKEKWRIFSRTAS